MKPGPARKGVRNRRSFRTLCGERAACRLISTSTVVVAVLLAPFTFVSPQAHGWPRRLPTDSVVVARAQVATPVDTEQLEAAKQRIGRAQRSLQLLKQELTDRSMFFRDPIDRQLIAEVIRQFAPAAAEPMRPLLDKSLAGYLPGLKDTEAIAALGAGMAMARLPHEPAWRALGDAVLATHKDATSQELVAMAWSFALAGEQRPELFDAMKASMATKVGELSEDQRNTFAWACAEIGEHARELFGDPTVNAVVDVSRQVHFAIQRLGDSGSGRSSDGSAVNVDSLMQEPVPLVVVHDVLSATDGEALIRLADEGGLWFPSSRRGARSAEGIDALRTSYSASLSSRACREHPVVEKVRRWAAETLEVPVDFVEYLQLVRYKEGEQYGAHVDWGRVVDASLWLGGQRTATCLIYLSTLTEGCGGTTAFDQLGLSVTPRAGSAVIWPNVNKEGVPEPMVEHRAMPLLCDATKYAVNVWIRGQPQPTFGDSPGN